MSGRELSEAHAPDRARADLHAFAERLLIGVLPQAMGSSVDAMLGALCRELDVPVAYLTTFTATHQVILRVRGDGDPIGIREQVVVPLQETYCIQMLSGRIPNTVVDARLEPCLADLPGANAGPTAYLGVPVHLPSGHVVGTLCCADVKPRPDLAPRGAGVLRAVSELIGSQLGELHANLEDHEDLVERVHGVLSQPDQMQPAYQPIVELASGTVVGVEALTRFGDHAVRTPDLWFAEAASIGMGVRLEVAAARRALDRLADLPPDCSLSVNLSPEVITPTTLAQLLADRPLHRVVLELTEHAAIEDYDSINGALRPFRRAGMRLAVDDVGAGFASLRHVLRTAPDIVKIDRSLVGQLATDRAQRAIVAAFAGMAHELGAGVIAEGIEDAATRDVLVEAGVSHGQGWFFEHARALPLRTLAYTAA